MRAVFYRWLFVIGFASWCAFGAFVARAADAVTWTGQPAYGTPGPFGDSSSTLQGFLDATAAHLRSANGWDVVNVQATTPVFSAGAYTASATFTKSDGNSGSYKVTGSCPSACQGDDAADSGWASVPKMVQAAVVVGLSGLFFMGIKTGMTR